MKVVENYYTKKKYDPVLPGPGDWPVVQLSKNRKAFIELVTTDSVNRIKALKPRRNSLIEELELTHYKEKLRIAQNPWKVDPEDDYFFWNKVKSRLLEITTSGSDNTYGEDELLREIVSRYANEITGNFKRTSYRMARSMVTFWFARLLNASRIKRFGSFWSNELTLQDKIHITGEIELLRDLAKIGTIVMVPTHFSNLDSVLIGYIIHALGLPPFIYGAGLNLFNIELFAYFMNSLGAYKVDRRKKNLIYLETLKSYSTQALLKGCHSLFFPGGTRSRSGKIENSLKLGLLGTAIEAQRLLFQRNPENMSNKIFIVPVVLNYNFVLEAPSLINDYLKQQGQERYYIETDEYSTSYKIIKFLFSFFTKGSDVSVSIGHAMDLFGNVVDNKGYSRNKQGRVINTRDYFVSNGQISHDYQREMEYTRSLSDHIVDKFHCLNQVFHSHLVAYTAFKLIERRYYKLDLFSLLRLPEEELIIEYQHFRDTFVKLRQVIFDKSERNELQVAPNLTGNVDEVIANGIDNVGMYHTKRAVIKNKQGDITTQDLNILYYYHNRLDGYDLQKHF
ncbi:MAG: 1-acyl-sn-glycerol-3-phosphate acyltransferase [Cyclobacteriaceae bacterium]